MSSKLEIILSVLSQGMDSFAKTGDHIDTLKKKTEGLGNATSLLKAPMAAFAVVSAAAAVAMKSMYEGMQFADSLKKQSDILSMSTTAVQEWNYVAKQSGSSAESITTYFAKFTKNIYDASNGNSSLAKNFKSLNVQLVDSKGNLRNVESITNDTMRALASIEDPIIRAGIAQDLFGRGSKDLLPLLANGTEALEAQKRAANELGQVLSERAIKALDDAGDTMDAFYTSMKVANAELISNLTPAIQSLAVVATKAMSAIGNMAQGLDWLIKGKSEFDAKMKESDAVANEIKEYAALKKELEETVKTQEALKKSGGSLFSPVTLADAKAGIEAINESLHAMRFGTAPKTGAKLDPQETGSDDDARLKKQKEEQAQQLRIQDYFNKEQEKSFDDAQKIFEQRQSDKVAAVSSVEDARIALIENSFDRERLVLNKKLRDDVKKYEGNADAIGSIQLAHSLRLSEIKKREQEDTKKKEDAKRDIAIQAGRDVLDTTTEMFQEMGAKSKAAAIAYKILASGTTLIDTYAGAQKAFNSLASIPVVGYGLGLGAAALTTAAGLYRVAKINSQSLYNGGQVVGEMGRELVNLPVGSQVINHHRTNQIINNKGGGTTLNVTVQADNGSVSSKFSRELRNGTGDYVVKKLMRKMRLN